MKRLRIVREGRALPEITVSAGVAAFLADGADRDASSAPPARPPAPWP